jgi:two-component system phosphate regulon sensor histidine kinase PhoR
MLRNASPQRLSLIAAFFLSIGTSVIFTSLAYIIYGKFLWKALFLGNILLFAGGYFVFKFLLGKFIYDKIKLIYKTIHDTKTTSGEKKYAFAGETDIIAKTNKDVSDWASDKSKEIEELKRLEKYRREFLGNVSHELKTPIFNIQGYVLTLLDGGVDDPAVNLKYLQRSEQSVNRLVSIVQDLEEISMLESGEVKMVMKPFDIISLSKEVMDFLEWKASENNISLLFGTSIELPIIVLADRKKIQQVLTNLIDNAIKYGVDQGRVKVSFYDMDANILVEVSDNGQGIPREHLPRVFERFYRGDKSRSRLSNQGGSGLGLAIVKHIIEAHGQTINVRSTPGIGTTFGFTLEKAESGARKASEVKELRTKN